MTTAAHSSGRRRRHRRPRRHRCRQPRSGRCGPAAPADSPAAAAVTRRDARPPAGAAIGPDQPGAIVLVSCYEPEYQPLAVASPAAFLTQASYAPLCVDLTVEDLETVGMERLRQARLVAISVPMHTATVLGLRVAERLRVGNERRIAGYVETTRGRLHLCRHCPAVL